MLKASIQRLLATFDYELRRRKPAGGSHRNVLYEVDAEFHGIRKQALEITGTVDGGAKSAEKLYNTIQFFKATAGVPGRTAECGVFRGLSAYVFCRYRQLREPGYAGAELSLFDSFEGLSELTSEDQTGMSTGAFRDRDFRKKGAFRGAIEVVRDTLREFPEVSIHPGWIPTVFRDVDDARYSFVHIDVDLYEPTRGAIEYFFPRLSAGGILVCDDYGFLHWPGAKHAIDEYCVPRGIPVVPLTTGQCIVLRPAD